MKIAILGTGFAGLATAWHLLQKGVSVTLFDPTGIGGQASSVSAGLLHTYVGLHAKYNLHGREGYEETDALLHVAEKALGKPVCSRSGLLRPALTEEQRLDYRLCAEKHADTEWLSAEQAQLMVPCVAPCPALWIKSAITVYPELYLAGLWKACSELGARWEQRSVTQLAELNAYDAIILATGPQTLAFPEAQGAKLHLLKGQILELSWPPSLAPLSMPVNSQAYIVMHRNHTSCIIGTTYERTFTSPEPDPEYAVAEILPKATACIPALAEAQVLGCRAGIRVAGPGHLPVVRQVAPKIWLYSGLGSKGLLYHALYARKLVQELVDK